MTASFRLPPSERDFEVFFKVMFHSVSTWQAAKAFNISQSRVRQVVALVGDWVADHLPDVGEADHSEANAAGSARRRQSAGGSIRTGDDLVERRNEPKHLRQATRIALAQARLGLVAGRVHALAADVTAGPLELGDEIPPVDARAASSPNGTSHLPSTMARAARSAKRTRSAASDCPETMIERELLSTACSPFKALAHGKPPAHPDRQPGHEQPGKGSRAANRRSAASARTKPPPSCGSRASCPAYRSSRWGRE